MFASRVVGYHGCEKAHGEPAARGEAPLRPSSQDHDWLGHGIYFWEGDARRAQEWAEYKRDHRRCKEPFVVGAIVDLGRCFDLTLRSNLDLLSKAYEDFRTARGAANLPIPENKNSPNVESTDKVIRRLDCAVLNYFCDTTAAAGMAFDTVRGVFVEGDPVYPGSEIYHKTHVQIAVRNPDCIKAVFIHR